jgi:peptidoglycan hydrolase-like protein with peptidoglycan-binding domain
VKLPQSGWLRGGDAGAAVVTLQKALLALGFDPGTPDGDFGAKTEAAVVGFQVAKTLDPDGVVGEKTASKLNAALRAG